MSIQRGIADTAQALGMSPTTLATIISYETAGTFDPTKKGPTTKWGQHKGFIQFGEPQAKQYGVDWRDPVNSQLGANGAVAKYFRDRGWKPGMNEMQAYSIVNAGAPNKFNASDTKAGGAPGTVRDKVLNQFAPHRAKAQKLMGGEYMPSVPRQQQKSVSDDDFADIFGGEWKPSSRFAAKSEPKANGEEPKVDDLFAGSWQPSRRYAQPQQDVTAPGNGFNPNPTTKREALTVADMPKRDFLTDLAVGGYRGLKDVGAGLVSANEMIASPFDKLNPLNNLVDTAAPRKAAAAYVDQANRADLERYKQGGYSDSGVASGGRIAGNVLPMLIPGASGTAMTGGIAPKMAQGAVVGAAHNVVTGSGRNPDADAATLAGQGALLGSVGTGIGAGIGRMAGSMASKQPSTNSAVQRLIRASGDNLDDVTAGARLQGALRQGDVTLVPGASPTLPQAAMLPGVSQAARDVKNYGGGRLLDKETMQEAARFSHLGTISDTAGLTAQDAAQAAGMQIGSQIRGAHQATKEATSRLYQDPTLQAAVVPTTGNKLAQIYDDAFVIGGRPVASDPTLKAAAEIMDSVPSLPFAEAQRLRSLVSGVSADFGKDPTVRMAATKMTKELDDILDTLPAFAPAKAARAEQGRLYESGIVGKITSRNNDRSYDLTEDAITRQLLSTSPGQTARAQQFNAVADQPSKDAAKQALMADLMERAGRNVGTDAQRLLPSQLTAYTNKRSGTIGEMLTAPEQAALRAVQQDAQRAAAADGLGKAVGSNTAQNMQSALNLGLMDNPALNAILGRASGVVPWAGQAAQAAAAGVKDASRKKLANELADLLADPKMTDEAITAYLRAVRGGQVGGKAGGLLSVPGAQGLLDENGFRRY
jgi:hypothetical protein